MTFLSLLKGAYRIWLDEVSADVDCEKVSKIVATDQPLQ